MGIFELIFKSTIKVEMIDKPSATITEAEAQLYDRQIRLWGLDAQKRLRSSRVLVAGMKGLGNEVAKNLVLAGVNSMTILDHELLTKEDGFSIFLAPTEEVGKNRAQASLERLKQRNPMVEITADETNLDTKEKEFFSNFDVVIVTNYPKDVTLKVNKFCRELKIKFLAGDIFGYFGYSFMDLVKHDYVEEEVKTVEAGDGKKSDDQPAAKKAKTDAEEEETKMVKKSMEFVPLDTALNVDWSADSYAKRIRRMDPSFFVLQILMEFQSREGSSPRAQMKQEVMKVISNKDAPHNTFFLYNPLESCGVVEAIGY